MPLAVLACASQRNVCPVTCQGKALSALICKLSSCITAVDYGGSGPSQPTPSILTTHFPLGLILMVKTDIGGRPYSWLLS